MKSEQCYKLINVTSGQNFRVAVHILAAVSVHNVVNLQNGPDRLASEGDGAGAPFFTLIPAVFSPWACLFLSSVTVPIGLRPAFSARV